MLSIKNATLTDIPLIIELTMQVWPQTYTPILGEEQVAYMLGLFYSPESLANQIEELKHTFIICYNDNEPVAFASWNAVDVAVYKLHKLYVLPGEQGRAIGRAIVKYIKDEIKRRNGKALFLNVNKYNAGAKAFYKKMGFEHVIDEDIDIGGGYFMNDNVLALKTPNP